MTISPVTPHPRVLITGGSGFLGQAIVRECLLPESPLQTQFVRILDIRPPSWPVPETVQVYTGDIRDEKTVLEACRDVDIVIHAAAIVDWGTHSEDEVYAINVTGTLQVVNACRSQGVGCLVYTSSLDAVFGGKPLAGINESQPYPGIHPNMYCRSKRLAEEMVLRADRRTSGQADGRTGGRADGRTGGLRRCVVRPSDIWGEGDPYHLASLINMAKGGFYIRLGNGSARCQHTYVGNVAYAHLLAARALWENRRGVDGSIYFITDGAPSNFFRFFDPIVEAAGYRIRPKNAWIPRWLAYGMGMMNESIAWLLKPIHAYTPKFSRFAVTYTCSDFTFNTNKAETELGFKPRYSHEEAVARTVDYYAKGGS